MASAFSTIVPIIVFVLLPSIFPNPTNSLNIQPTLPNSKYSPTYIGSLRMSRELGKGKVIRQPIGHAQQIQRRAFPATNSNQTSVSNLIKIPPLPVFGTDLGGSGGYWYGVKIGIGYFDTSDPFYKTYQLNFDTGATFTWLQCEGCQQPGNECYPQMDPLFPNSQSEEYLALKENDIFCPNKPPNPSPDKLCYYDVKFADGGETYGELATDVFTFDSNIPDNPSLVATFVFGCGLKQTGFNVKPTEPDANSGTLGFGRGKLSLPMQLDPNTDQPAGLNFSYCFQDLRSHGGPDQVPTYLRFADDISQDSSTFQLTPLVPLAGDDDHYHVNLAQIKVGDISGSMSSPVTVILDTGTSVSYLVKPVFTILEDLIDDWFASLRSIRERMPRANGLTSPPDICYKKAPGAGFETLPTIHLVLDGGVDFEIKPEQGFVVLNEGQDEYFCLMIYPDDKFSIIGAYQQVNHRFIYDTQQNLLLFKSDDCAANP